MTRGGGVRGLPNPPAHRCPRAATTTGAGGRSSCAPAALVRTPTGGPLGGRDGGHACARSAQLSTHPPCPPPLARAGVVCAALPPLHRASERVRVAGGGGDHVCARPPPPPPPPPHAPPTARWQLLAWERRGLPAAAGGRARPCPPRTPTHAWDSGLDLRSHLAWREGLRSQSKRVPAPRLPPPARRAPYPPAAMATQLATKAYVPAVRLGAAAVVSGGGHRSCRAAALCPPRPPPTSSNPPASPRAATDRRAGSLRPPAAGRGRARRGAHLLCGAPVQGDPAVAAGKGGGAGRRARQPSGAAPARQSRAPRAGSRLRLPRRNADVRAEHWRQAVHPHRQQARAPRLHAAAQRAGAAVGRGGSSQRPV